METMDMTSTSTLRSRAAVAGVLSAAAAVGIGDLVAALVPGGRSLYIAVGDLVISVVPEPVKSFAISLFGTGDKIALLVGIAVIMVALAAGIGVLGLRRTWAGYLGVAALGAVGLLAAAVSSFEGGAPAVALPPAAGTAAGILALRLLLAPLRAQAPARSIGGRAIDDPPPGDRVDRRRFLVTAGTIALAAATAGSVGRLLTSGANVMAQRAALALGTASLTVPPLPTDADFQIDGLSPFLTPNSDFYRIDTALRPPLIDVETWRLRLTGMVDREVELSYDELQDIGLIERYITLACVSNEVGGGLVGTAKWLGVPLRDVLDRARPSSREGLQVVGRSVDGMTNGFPIEAAYDDRDALVAVGMNDEPLPVEHGYPVRLVVPGLYGYVSATKWLTEIEVTTFDDFDQYWVERGWDERAPIKLMSRIDVPRGFAEFPPGRVTIAGVAWAPRRGIGRVEVRLGDGDWQEADLGAPVDIDTWRQWRLSVEIPEPGPVTATVRAFSRTGESQPEVRTEPFPSGATGWHTVTFRIAEPA